MKKEQTKKELTVLIDLNELYNVVLNLEKPCSLNQKIGFELYEDDNFDYKLYFSSMFEESNRFTPGTFYLLEGIIVDYNDEFLNFYSYLYEDGEFIGDEEFKCENDYLNYYDFTDELNDIYNRCCNILIDMMPQIDVNINTNNEYKIHFKVAGE